MSDKNEYKPDLIKYYDTTMEYKFDSVIKRLKLFNNLNTMNRNILNGMFTIKLRDEFNKCLLPLGLKLKLASLRSEVPNNELYRTIILRFVSNAWSYTSTPHTSSWRSAQLRIGYTVKA
jgi:hypothetical protein